jgi:hypothetical protein
LAAIAAVPHTKVATTTDAAIQSVRRFMGSA